MKIYKITFREVSEEYSPKRFEVKNTKKETMVLSVDRSITVLETELQKYWDYGKGYDTLTCVGELNDSYFKPTLSEADFVDNEIKSKKNGDVIGYQG